MKIQVNQKLRQALVEAIGAARETRFKLDEAQKKFDLSLQEQLPQLGMGREAFVSHIHADAHFGHQCPDLVISRVVHAFGREGGAVLRIQLGTVKGKLGVHYAFLKAEDVVKVVSPSALLFT